MQGGQGRNAGEVVSSALIVGACFTGVALLLAGAAVAGLLR